MDLELLGKRVIVAGASRGIGLEIARRFLEEGSRVAIIARNTSRLENAAKELIKQFGPDLLMTFSMDCADSQAWEKVKDNINKVWGGADIVVANVGDGTGQRDVLPNAMHFDESWRTNFETAVETSRVAIQLIKEDGAILFVSSIAGLEVIGAPIDYSVAKAALLALAKQMSRQLAPKIRINCLVPGNVFIPGGTWEKKINLDPSKVEKYINSCVPMRRFGTVNEMADAALFLCSKKASFITGAYLVVDGGQTVRMP